MRTTYLGLLLWVVLFSFTSSARAWDFREHSHIGSVAWQMACTRLTATLKPVQDGTAAERRRRNVVTYLCGDRSWRDVYGQWNALAGDHVDDPQNLETVTGSWTALRARKYLGLALHNADHFLPRAKIVWRQHHADAVQLARKALSSPTWSRSIVLLHAALREEAYAAHFLEDAFSSGHMTFNRAATPPVAALALHDELAWRGLRVTAADGAVWEAFGDHKLFHSMNRENLRRVQRSASASLFEVFSVLTGVNDENPAEAASLQPRRYAVTPQYEGAWHPLTSRYTQWWRYALSLGFVGPKRIAIKNQKQPAKGDGAAVDALHAPSYPFLTTALSVAFTSFDKNPSMESVALGVRYDAPIGALLGTMLGVGFRLVPTKSERDRYFYTFGAFTIPMWSSHSSLVGLEMNLGLGWLHHASDLSVASNLGRAETGISALLGLDIVTLYVTLGVAQNFPFPLAPAATLILGYRGDLFDTARSKCYRGPQ